MLLTLGTRTSCTTVPEAANPCTARLHISSVAHNAHIYPKSAATSCLLGSERECTARHDVLQNALAQPEEINLVQGFALKNS
jgi:hypothetical protein